MIKNCSNCKYKERKTYESPCVSCRNENLWEDIDMGKYESISQDIGRLVDEKNSQYGDSINSTAEFLRLLFPEGIPVEAYGDLGVIVRVFDKLKRIANGNQGEENAWSDLAGYGILMANKK